MKRKLKLLYNCKLLTSVPVQIFFKVKINLRVSLMLYPAERQFQFRATTHRNVVCNYLVTSPLSVAPSREKKPSNERFRSMC